MGEEVLLAISTFPDAETAQRIAEQLVTEKLAACANITMPLQSIYRWKENVEKATETMVLFKTTESRFASFEAALRSRHPYDVPEVIALRVVAGSSAYLEWVAQSCQA